MTTFDVRRADDRAHTRISWLDSRHSFSFGHHWNPANTHFGLLLVNNDDVVAPGTGFDTHPHRDMEIVTWVLRGQLVHQDSEGHNGVIYPGLAQRMSAGRGILHSEKNDAWRLTAAGTGTSGTGTATGAATGTATGTDAADGSGQEPVHFVQMWVVPDEARIDPGYEQLEIDDAKLRGGLVPIASGRPGHDSGIRIHQRDAALHGSRMDPGAIVTLPDAPWVHVFVPRGTVALEGAGDLVQGDAARIAGGGGQRVVAGPDGAEILVWEMHSELTA